MIKIVKRIIRQYLTCKHSNKVVIKKIICTDNTKIKAKWMEKFECQDCKRTFYGKYFYEYGDSRHYVD
jgi:transposase-like protein